MIRDLRALQARSFDVVVVGGGIHGACAAWESARRGLRVALVERDDFCSATSSNSLRTLHGGLRYLQHVDLKRMRESIRERREWLRLAPHLTRPMQFVLPTTGLGLKGPYALRTALLANDIISADRNKGVRPENHLPGGAMLTRAQTAQLLDGTTVSGFNGAAAWYDGICLNTERLTLQVLGAAGALGAATVNYVEAKELLSADGAVHAVRVVDHLHGDEFRIKARVVVNAAGPWVGEWLPDSMRAAQSAQFRASTAFNLLVRPRAFESALGFAVPRQSRDADALLDRGSDTYFVIPWNGFSLIGTRHLRCAAGNRDARVTTLQVRDFVAQLNALLGRHRLSSEDILGVFSGLLPEREHASGTDVVLDKTARIIDHAQTDQIDGLLSVVGVKWTTARLLGERAARRAGDLLGAVPRELAARQLPSPTDWSELIQQDATLAEPIVVDQPCIWAQLIHAVRHESAYRLTDVIFRRTSLFLSEHLSGPIIEAAAVRMGRELHWSGDELRAQIAAAQSALTAFRPLIADLP